MRITTAFVSALVAVVGTPTSAVPAVDAVQTCNGRPATIVAVPPASGVAPPVEGTPGDDVIVGTDGDDVIFGHGGNDTICAYAGRDVLHGGPGDDWLHGGLDGEYFPDDGVRGDVVVPGPGDDVVDLGDDPSSAHIAGVDRFAFYDTVSYRDASGPVHVDLAEGTATGEGQDTIVVPAYSGGIVGSDFDDVLAGSARPDRIDGGGGDDRIIGRAGRDDILPDNRGRPLSDVPWESDLSAGDDTVLAGAGRDLVWSRRGVDRLVGGDDGDYLHHQGALGRLYGGDGRDSLAASRSARLRAWGGRGSDVLTGGRFADVLDGGPGRDVLTGGRGHDRCLRGERLRSCEARR
jgi:Ca2+-binding RTX toxin-like protein